MPRPASRTGASRNVTSSSSASRSGPNPPSSSGSVSTRAQERPPRRAPRSGSTTVRTCCASGASTTARARACSPNASRTTRTGAADALRLVFAGPVVNEPPAHPDIVTPGAVDEAVKWGLLRGARRARLAERVRVVLDRAHGSVVGRHTRARQQPLRGDARPRAALGRWARVRQLRRVRGRARPARRRRHRCAPRSAAPVGRSSTVTTAGPTSSTATRHSWRRSAPAPAPLSTHRRYASGPSPRGSDRGSRHMYARKYSRRSPRTRRASPRPRRRSNSPAANDSSARPSP